MNRRDEVFNAIEEHMANWMANPGKVYEELDRIYGVLPDDGEVATYGWVVDQCGGKCVQYAGLCHLYCHDTAQLVVVPFGINRMSFRKLCEALGVELKEVKGE